MMFKTPAIRLSIVLVQADLEGGVFGKDAFLVDPAAWQLTGLTEERCMKARQTAAEQLNAVSESITALDSN